MQSCTYTVQNSGSAVAFGTPDMARELDRLYRMEGFKDAGIAVLAGHDEGLISFGTTLEEAASRMLLLNESAS